jgi:hypothetical protein
MYSEQPEDDARQKATELQAEYPDAVVGVHELPVSSGIAWCTIALIPDGRCVTSVFTTADRYVAMMASATMTARVQARLSASVYREHRA